MLQLIKNRNEKFEIFIQNRSPLFHIFFNISVTYNTLVRFRDFFRDLHFSLDFLFIGVV